MPWGETGVAFVRGHPLSTRAASRMDDSRGHLWHCAPRRSRPAAPAIDFRCLSRQFEGAWMRYRSAHIVMAAMLAIASQAAVAAPAASRNADVAQAKQRLVESFARAAQQTDGVTAVSYTPLARSARPGWAAACGKRSARSARCRSGRRHG